MIHLDDLLAATGGRLVGPATPTEFPGWCYNTQRLRPGELFVAVKTEGGDGHDYLAEAVDGEAGGILCQFPPLSPGIPCVVVPDTRMALTDWASFHMA